MLRPEPTRFLLPALVLPVLPPLLVPVQELLLALAQAPPL
jgi:hypothetical protein